MSREVVIVGAARTPIGAFQGSLAPLSAPKLGAVAISGALERAGVAPEEVQEVLMGEVLQAGVGQAPARQAALGAGLPESVPCTTVNKVCGSGLKTVILGAQIIANGDADVVVAGGMESMSNAPYALPKARSGYRMGNGELVDLMIYDGLWDPYNDFHMGNAGELCARECKIPREEQDRYAVQSTKRAIAAMEAGKFKAEIVPVKVPQRKGDPIVVDTDDGPKNARPDKIPSLRPAFQKDGTITAGNASSINDGAAAVVLMSRERCEALGRTPLATIKGYGGAARKPEWFTVAPADAIRAAMQSAGTKVEEIDLWEINEAFAVVALVNNRELGLSEEKVNVRGGAVALGHPIGASGTRLLVTLLYTMIDEDKKLGCVSLCIGGGEGIALVVER
ncbi:MAG: acetyl-CoA C-acetyltransferase [Deltaproteobacteria bacterium]|nr:MAG: acetyl-CoA C-acetyltransferase [Deltaproteobacteria bacterium]